MVDDKLVKIMQEAPAFPAGTPVMESAFKEVWARGVLHERSKAEIDKEKLVLDIEYELHLHGIMSDDFSDEAKALIRRVLERYTITEKAP